MINTFKGIIQYDPKAHPREKIWERCVVDREVTVSKTLMLVGSQNVQAPNSVNLTHGTFTLPFVVATVSKSRTCVSATFLKDLSPNRNLAEATLELERELKYHYMIHQAGEVVIYLNNITDAAAYPPSLVWADAGKIVQSSTIGLYYRIANEQRSDYLKLAYLDHRSTGTPNLLQAEALLGCSLVLLT